MASWDDRGRILFCSTERMLKLLSHLYPEIDSGPGRDPKKISHEVTDQMRDRNVASLLWRTGACPRSLAQGSPALRQETQ